MIKQKIIAMGGGGFSTELDNSLLDQYILNASDAAKPRICLLPTAGGDSEFPYMIASHFIYRFLNRMLKILNHFY